MSKHILLLKSSYTSNVVQEKNQDKLIQIFTSKKKKVRCVDGALPERKQTRTDLFNVAVAAGFTKRAYPLVFKSTDANEYEFVGDFDALIDLVECEEFDTFFEDCSEGIVDEDMGN